ncbi:MAG: hypothetical protein EBY45_11590 [Gammaproteobacteria bacterium]|nr:hypothetical protein [Gammaproteobacteria bacterium]
MSGLELMMLTSFEVVRFENRAKISVTALFLFCLTFGASGAAQEADEADDDIDLFVVVPHLEDRELGEPNLDDEGEPVVWDHPLPYCRYHLGSVLYPRRLSRT